MAGEHLVRAAQGRTVSLGVIRMRVLAAGEPTGGAFSLVEFQGDGGPWTVPHIHQHTKESFYVLDGTFMFTVGGDQIEAEPGTYLLVPRGTPHVMVAGPDGGRFLTLMVPGGLEEMFFELGRLPPDSLRDPEARAAISERYDSIPVTG
jgi:quercetin dioxygenase-like cupin family protein